MALNTTTLSAAVAVNDTAITVASATGIAAGKIAVCDGEIMQVRQDYVAASLTVPVLRGREGTATATHASSANITFELANDIGTPATQTSIQKPAVRARTIKSYSASGAIDLPAPGSDAVAILNGTSALAMTLANPTKDMDGDELTIVGNGKSASTVTYTAGFGNAGSSYDVITMQTAGQVSYTVIAANGIWVSKNTPTTGTTTALSVAIA